MNTYKKYCPNVFVAQCEDKHEKGDVIVVETKYGKQNECIVQSGCPLNRVFPICKAVAVPGNIQLVYFTKVAVNIA